MDTENLHSRYSVYLFPASIIAILIAWGLYWELCSTYSWTDSFEDYMISILAAVIGVIGVSITGYIFMIESIRSLGDSDPYKKSVADSVRSRIYNLLSIILVISIVEIILCAVGIDGESESDQVAVLVSVIFTYILIYSIWLDMRMMNFNKGLTYNANGRLRHMRLMFDTKPLIIRVDSEEYNHIVAKRKTGNMEDFTEDHDRSFTIPGNENDDDNSVSGDITTVPANAQIQSHTNARRRSSDPNNQIFFVIHGYDDNILFSEEKSAFLRMRFFKLNRWSIIGYCDIHDEFEVYDVFHVFETVEKILCKIIGTDSPVINRSEHSKLGSALSKGKPYRVEAGMVDDIISLYFLIREYRDNYMVRFEEDYNNIRPSPQSFDKLPLVLAGENECVGLVNYTDSSGNGKALSTNNARIDRLAYMQAVSPFVFLLRYELSKKISGTDISRLSLNGYDFSYGELKGTILRGSMLLDTMFFATNLTGADFGKCDLTGATFSKCIGYAAYFGEAVFSSTLIENTPLEGSVFDLASIAGSVFPNLNMKGCAFTKASIVNTAFENTRLTNSSFLESKFISSKLQNCLMSDCKLASITISESLIVDCDLGGSSMMRSSISTSSLRDCKFIRVLLNDSNITSDMIVNCDFSNSQCHGVNFTGTQILSATFDSASLNRSNFTHAYIGPYSLDPKSKWPARDSELYDEYNVVQQKLKSIRVADRKDADKKDADKKDADKKVDIAPISLQKDVLSHVSSFSNSLAEHCIFSDAELFQCRMQGTLFNSSSFTNTKLLSSSFQNASFARTLFTDALITDCSFTNASFGDALISNSMFRNSFLHNVSFAGCTMTQCSIFDSDLLKASFDKCTLVNCTFYNVENISSSIFRSTISNLSLHACNISGTIISGEFNNAKELEEEYKRLVSGGR